MATGDHGKNTDPAPNHAMEVFNTVSVNVTILHRNTEDVHAKASTDTNVVVLMIAAQVNVFYLALKLSIHSNYFIWYSRPSRYIQIAISNCILIFQYLKIL